MKPDITIKHKNTYNVSFEGPCEIEVQELKETLGETYKAWNIGIKSAGLTGNEYQELASRTIRDDIGVEDKIMHALHGMVGEIGELHSIYQKYYQGHPLDSEHLKKELGDLLWFIAEYCTAYEWNLEDIMQMNIDKLKSRYPEGFSENKSLNRAEGDI